MTSEDHPMHLVTSQTDFAPRATALNCTRLRLSPHADPSSNVLISATPNILNYCLSAKLRMQKCEILVYA